MNQPVLYAGTSPLGIDRRTRGEVRDALARFLEVGESAPAETLDRTSVRESTIGGATNTRPGRMLLRLITAGWSLNGNLYPAEVLRRDGATAWPAGTRCYIDHATDEEEQAHPSGSVKNLAAVLTSDAHWDEATQSLVAEARLFEPWRGRLSEMAEADAIGMSIRAWVTGEQGEQDGRTGFLVASIPEGRSVDFVTVPAAGGAVISVLEAVGAEPVTEAANLGAWLESRLHLALTTYADEMYGDGRLTRPERIVLSQAIGDGLQAWTARVETDAPQLFQRSRWEEPTPAEPIAAGETDQAAEPAGPEPSATTEDVTDGAPPPTPATPPNEHEEEPVSGSQTGAPPPEQAGTAMVPDNVAPTAPTAEAVIVQPTAEAMSAMIAAAVREATAPLTAQLTEMSARESARDAALRDARNRQTATEAATTALQAAEHNDVRESVRARVTTRITGAVPTGDDGNVDQAALGELITSVIADEANHVRRERANALAEAGVGLPYGMGGTPAAEAAEDDGLDAEFQNFFHGTLGLSESAAKIAAKGRV